MNLQNKTSKFVSGSKLLITFILSLLRIYMQKLIIFILCLCYHFGIYGQTNDEKILEIVKEGVILHDGRSYDKAIQKYEEALAIDKKSTLANYELAMTYSEIGRFKEALKYANRVIKQKKDNMVAAYMVKGNVLDEQGKTKKSIKLFKKAIAETSGHYLLNYNLGINYFKQGELDLASQEMINAIKQNPSHSSSHLYLALAQKRKQEVTKSLLPVYYFLLLEPTSDRAKNAQRLLQDNLAGDVSRDAVDDQQINIVIDDSDNPYSSVELMISMLSATRFADDTKQLTDEQFFMMSTKGLFELLGNLDLKTQDVWSELYIPFFDKLVKSEHLETFCQYILQVKSDAATQWVAFHPDEIESFFVWLNK